MTGFKWFCDTWINLENKAHKTNNVKDWKFFEFFLKEGKREFSKNLISCEKEEWKIFYSDLLKLISYKLKEIVLVYKDNKIPF